MNLCWRLLFLCLGIKGDENPCFDEDLLMEYYAECRVELETDVTIFEFNRTEENYGVTKDMCT